MIFFLARKRLFTVNCSRQTWTNEAFQCQTRLFPLSKRENLLSLAENCVISGPRVHLKAHICMKLTFFFFFLEELFFLQVAFFLYPKKKWVRLSFPKLFTIFSHQYPSTFSNVHVICENYSLYILEN